MTNLWRKASGILSLEQQINNNISTTINLIEHLEDLEDNLTATVRSLTEKIQQSKHRFSTMADKMVETGDRLQQQGKWELAIFNYQRALTLKPDLAQVYWRLGFALESQGKRDEAIINYQQACQLQPDWADAYLSLGNALTIQRRWDEAIASYQKRLQIKPDCAITHKALGQIREHQGRLDEAITHYRQALHLQPENAAIVQKIEELNH